ncbi:DUF4260 domain-containing protein [Paenibacillus sp. 1P07SE]|uniref:DUF4260 domain-containing protein n=1 Tax=Paenibacillus sp. 1P07SE TaxID=3132209 RepID=UPI0039A473DC
MNQRLIQLEGLIVLGLAIYFYFSSGYGWAMFLLLLFVPDLSMIGYAVNNKVGAYVYNAAHTYTVPLLLLLVGLLLSAGWLMMIGFIWVAHIGMDRMLGFGLKYETGFKDTHLQRL